VTSRERRAALQVVRSLRQVHPDLVVALGGAGAPDEPGVLRLTDSLPSSVAALAAAVDARAQPN